MNIEEARLYLEHTSKEDFNLEEHQKENRYQAIQVVLKEIERLNNIINGMEKFFQYAYDNEVRPLNDRKVSVWTICLDKLQELRDTNDTK